MSSLSGVLVNLSTAQHQSVANASINLQELAVALQANGIGTSPQEALQTKVSVSQLVDAIADAARSSGSASAAAALDTLTAQLSGVTGQVSLADVLGVDTRTAVMTQASINALDLVNAIVATQSFDSTQVYPVSTTGTALGVGANLGAVQLSVVVVEKPRIVCGPVGSRFASAALRVRAHVDLLASTPVKLDVGLAKLSLSMTALDLVVAVGSASGTLQTINSIAQAVTAQAASGLAEVYLGSVSDAVLSDRATAIVPATELGYASVAAIQVTLLGATVIEAAVQLRAYAQGTSPTPSTLSFAAPYPATRKTMASATLVNQLVSTLLNSLDVRLQTTLLGLNLGDLLNTVLGVVTNVLKTTTNGVLSTPLTALLSGVVDPLLAGLGLGLGPAAVTVDRVFPIPAGAACDDGLFCTSGDTCSASKVCAGAARSCSDGLDCTADSCDEGADRCVNTIGNSCVIGGACYASGASNPSVACQACTPATSTTAWTTQRDGQPCSDGLFCTENDACSALGLCLGTPKTCSDSLTCTLDVCSELNDTCSNTIAFGCAIAGACYAAGTNNPQNACQSCAPLSSATSWTDKVQGTQCSDGLFCTVNDACDGAGNCTSVARDCSDGKSCTLDVCNESMSACASSLVGGCLIGSSCYGTGALNPANPCQQCDPSRSTSGWSNRTAGSSCSDGLFCTENDACNASGACTGTAKSCSDSLSCTTDTCNEQLDRCDSALTGGCVINNTCYGADIDNPANACQSCRPSASTSTWTNKASSATCDDGQFCTVSDQCDGAGTCRGSARDCGIGAGCSAGSCDEAADACQPVTSGCVIAGACFAPGAVNPANSCQTCNPSASASAWTNKPLNASCSDDQFCTVNDSCRTPGVCTGDARSCSDGLDCTTEACNEQSDRCEQTAQTGCVIVGVCYAQDATNPSNACQACSPASSASGWTAKAAGSSCDDGQYCTANDSCNASGRCTGSARDCSTGQSCSTGSCNENTDSCERSISGCLIDDSCYVAQQANPRNPCQLCDPARSNTSWSNRAEGTTCSDGLFCTVDDACNSAGVCASKPRSCDDMLGCTVDVCNEAGQRCDSTSMTGCTIAGACFPNLAVNPNNACQACVLGSSQSEWTLLAAGTPCSDGAFCTSGDTCNASGVCAGAQATCNDGLACTSDVCNESSDRCDASVAANGCAIDGACYAAGDPDPQNACRACDPSASTSRWTNKVADSPCGNGNYCTVDTCNGAGSCVSTARDCSDGVACTTDSCDETQRRCQSMTSSGCLIDGRCVASNARDPGNDCRSCKPAQSTTQWTNEAQGASCSGGVYCTVNRSCDGSGSCTGGTPRNCDDTLACSQDRCDETRDSCVHVATDGCVVDGVCSARGAINPQDLCQVCDPTLSANSWSTVQSDQCLDDDDPDMDGFTTREECPLGRAMCPDTDRDGTLDYNDTDDDGDTVFTRFERASNGDLRDSDSDGRADHLDADDDDDGVPTREEDPDPNGDGDPADARDSDGDRIPDYLESDDDGDGLSTKRERDDADLFGMDDDEDDDSLPNWLDADSDGDGVSDEEESRGDGDSNDDDIPDYLQANVPGTDAGVDSGAPEPTPGGAGGVGGRVGPAAGSGGRAGQGGPSGQGGTAAVAGSGGRGGQGGTAVVAGRGGRGGQGGTAAGSGGRAGAAGSRPAGMDAGNDASSDNGNGNAPDDNAGAGGSEEQGGAAPEPPMDAGVVQTDAGTNPFDPQTGAVTGGGSSCSVALRPTRPTRPRAAGIALLLAACCWLVRRRRRR
ncbi:MAG: hypothetical protein ABW321_02175 [Polyangiales bacterium]